MSRICPGAPIRGVPGSREETSMNEMHYPNESKAYRDARNALLKDEQ